jgi:hypothetical protein
MRIKAYLEMLMEHVIKFDTTNSREISRAVSWSLLPVGCIQFNVDASLFASSNRMGAGIVARDHHGSFIAAFADIFPSVVHPKLAEAMAIRSALLWAVDDDIKCCSAHQLP